MTLKNQLLSGENAARESKAAHGGNQRRTATNMPKQSDRERTLREIGDLLAVAILEEEDEQWMTRAPRPPVSDTS
jgi:hypothetical protein